MSKNNKQLKDKIIFNFNSGNYDQAKLLLSYALKKNPNNFEYLNLIGYLCGIKNNYQERLEIRSVSSEYFNLF